MMAPERTRDRARRPAPAARRTRRAATLALSTLPEGIVAAVSTGTRSPQHITGHLDLLDPAGGTVDRLITVHGSESPGFASLPDRDAGLVGFAEAGRPAIEALDPELERAAVTPLDADRGTLVALAEERGHVVALQQSDDAAGGSGQSLWHLGTGGDDGPWHAIDIEGLALSRRRRITMIAMFSGHLHVAVADAVAGCDLFRIAPGEPKAPWSPVFARGGHRFALDAAVATMQAGTDRLLLGTAALWPGPMTLGNWGPELIAVAPDASWDLIIGQPRFTPQGLKLPASALMPGIGDTRNAALVAIASGPLPGRSPTVIAIQDFAGHARVDRATAVPEFGHYRGAVRLFMSDDLVDWRPLDPGLPRDAGAVRALAVSQVGVVVGHEGPPDDEIAPVTVVPI